MSAMSQDPADTHATSSNASSSNASSAPESESEFKTDAQAESVLNSDLDSDLGSEADSQTDSHEHGHGHRHAHPRSPSSTSSLTKDAAQAQNTEHQNQTPSVSLKQRFFPNWLTHYSLKRLPADVVAGIIVGVLVIPQSLGYAVLAGLPPEYGLYTSILPVLVYAWFGSSNVQAIGPVAITAIMTASSLHRYADAGMAVYASMATLLAAMVGLMLWLAGQLKLGWIMQFISRGVSAGFVSGAAVLIFVSQIKYLTAVPMSGNSLSGYVNSLLANISHWHMLTFAIGAAAFVLLCINRYGRRQVWQSWLPYKMAKWLERLFPLLLIVVAIGCSAVFAWQSRGVATIGSIPNGLPSFTLPYLPSVQQLIGLLPAAGLMALIIFISSSSVAGTYARLRGEPFAANLELKSLGLANMAGGFFQSFAVAGGFSRTAINVDSGASSPIASVVTAGVMVLALLAFGNILAPMPYALLGAIIMASIVGLVDWRTLRTAWRHDRLDAISFLAAFLGVLALGLNTGLVIGLLVSFASLIWQYSQPHIAVVGLLAGTEHFRNINRHDVITFDNLLILRVDESLFFGNSQSVHDRIFTALLQYPEASELILIFSAVNHIDLTAQEMLISLNKELVAQDKRLHYCYVKGPVMDVIGHTEVIQALSGNVFLSTMDAVRMLKR